MNISELMTRDVDVIDANATVRDAAVRTRDEDIGALPVGEKDRLVGMVTDRDIVARALARAGATEHALRGVSEPTRKERL